MHRLEPLPEPDVGGVPRNLLRDAVFARLLSSILRGEYRRGQRLRLDTIASDMRVSRTPVREALVPLETLRLVTVQRYVGVVIANWGIENMIERLHIVQSMLRPADESPAARRPREPFDPVWARDCLSEAGVFSVIAEWNLRELDRPVSADWVASQRPALDMFYTAGVAAVHGIDVAVGQVQRSALIARAHEAAIAGDLAACAFALDRYAREIATVQERFRPGASSRSA